MCYFISLMLVLKRFTANTCQLNPCLNGGKCIPGKIACECSHGWMGQFCHRHCRNIYKSCDRWALEEKCEMVRTKTNFFDINCAISCHRCTPDEKHMLSEIPVPPSLEPLLFMVGRWYSLAKKRLRYPIDMYSDGYREILDITPTEVPMFGTPSLNLTSSGDLRLLRGFLTLRPNSAPTEIAILSTSNEGLNMIELGTLTNHLVALNITYMQVHPGMNASILPLGATRIFRRNGRFLEMIVSKLFSHNRITQFRKLFRKIKSYPL
ncbi:unnamed protein product [Dracunculus medinensis]|uniref:EGF-like domain-containing protein n=1 Tax=Dracunculus medinensis TaxID=318479 RepID=A0A0N4U8D7_DRAME|nr:unnamed protein product [Dracunculus medinensis]